MDNVLSWLCWLEVRDQRVVWDRACGCPRKVIAARQDMDRTTAWRHWVSALATITNRLGGRGDKMQMQHFSMQQIGPDLVR